jgi:hypothetical protein
MRDRHRVGQPTWVTIRNCHDVGRPSRVHRARLNCGKNVDRKEDEPKKRKPWDSSPALELSQDVFFASIFESPVIEKETSRPADQASLPKGHNELTMLFKPIRMLACDNFHAQLNAFITNDARRLPALRVH